MTKLTVATIGHMPDELDICKIKNWKSSMFSIAGQVESFPLKSNSDIDGWAFSDTNLKQNLPETFGGNFLFAIVNVPLELNWFSRRCDSTRIIITLHEIKGILSHANIPIENVVFRLIYFYTLVYLRNGDSIPTNEKLTKFTHDETRGCLFDMDGIKTDIIYSCHNPIICSSCIDRLRHEGVSNEVITIALKEIKNIKKPLFYRIISFVRKHPIWSLIISIVSAIISGTIGSFIANMIFEATKRAL